MNDPDPRHTSDGFDHDAIFADIVAHLNDDAPEPVERVFRWVQDAATETEPAMERAEDQAEDQAEHPADDQAADDQAADPAEDQAESPAENPATTDQQPGEERWLLDPSPGEPTSAEPQPLPTPQVWRAHEVDDEYEEHFEPRPVVPLPVGDLQFWAIIAGMGGGPLLLLYLVLFNREAGGYWLLTSIAMSVGGFVLLVARMPGHEGDDDDGARL